MSKLFFVLCFCFLHGVLCNIDDTFQFLSKETEACASQCEQGPQANEKSILQSCVRGCRLFAICEWDSLNFTKACNNCKLACDEAYENNVENKEACAYGCDAALPLAEQRHQNMKEQAYNVKKYDDPFPNLFGVKGPFSDDDLKEDDFYFYGLDSFINDVMESAIRSFDRMHGFMTSSHHTEIIDIKNGDREQIIIVEFVAPQLHTPHPNNKKIMLNTGSNRFKTTLKDHLESNLQTNVNSDISNRISRSEDANLSFNNKEDAKPCCCTWNNVKSRLNNMWDCAQQGDCLAELALIVFWISVSMLLLMACCFQSPTKKQLSVNGDLALITDSKGSLPSYIQPYPAPEEAKKSPYYMASVVADEKVPMKP